MKKNLILLLVIFFPHYLLSAHQKPGNGRHSTNKPIVTRRMPSPSQASRDALTSAHVSDQLRFVQWKQQYLEEQLKIHSAFLMQIQSTLVQILQNQQGCAPSSLPYTMQQQAAQQHPGTTQANGVIFSQQSTQNQDPEPFPYQISEQYSYGALPLLNAAAYTQMFVPQSGAQETTEQEPLIAQEKVNGHDDAVAQPGQSYSPVGTARFLELFNGWKRAQGTDHKEQDKRQ